MMRIMAMLPAPTFVIKFSQRGRGETHKWRCIGVMARNFAHSGPTNSVASAFAQWTFRTFWTEAVQSFGLCRFERRQIMVFLRDSEATIVHVAAQSFEDTADKGTLPIRGHRQKLPCDRCCRCEARDQLRGSGTPHRAVGEAHTNTGQSRSSSQLAQFLCRVQREGAINAAFASAPI